MLLTILFIFILLSVLCKLIKFAFKMSWGIIKILFYIVFAPVILIAIFASGLIYLALGLAVIMGIITLFVTAVATR